MNFNFLNFQRTKIITGVSLVILGILFRTAWHLAPNVEYVTTASLLAGAYLGRKHAILVPFMIMVISDTLIGNSNIFVFTWSGYILIGLTGYIIKTQLEIPTFALQNDNLKFKILGATGLGIGASLFFYVWTNFGVWALDSWGMYSHDLNGLIKCYVMGLPFLKLNLLGNLFFVPVSFWIVESVKSLNRIFSKSFWQLPGDV